MSPFTLSLVYGLMGVWVFLDTNSRHIARTGESVYADSKVDVFTYFTVCYIFWWLLLFMSALKNILLLTFRRQ